MKCFVIYDETGRIYAAEYGDKPTLPNEIKFMQTDIEDESRISRVDISDPDNHKLIFIVTKEKVLENELAEVKKSNNKLKAQLEYLSMMSGFKMEENNEKEI